MSKLKRNVLIIVSIVVVIGVSIGSKYLLDVQNYKNEVSELTINNPDLKNIEDGNYTGVYDAQFIKVNLTVEVKDHKMMAIVLNEHINGKGKPAETILNDVIKAQSLDVDTVSGATNSSKVILKSIERALTNG